MSRRRAVVHGRLRAASISTTYRRFGLLHAKHRDHYGVDVLVVQGASTSFNPTLPPSREGAGP
jgi:hypothetical protein